MEDSYDYGKRADEIADATRRFLVGLNTGGIGIALTFAASMAERLVHPAWAAVPVLLFAGGLGVSGFSLLLAKHKALKRRDAANEGKPIPRYDALCQRNFTYEIITLIVFLAAVGTGLYQLTHLKLSTERPREEKLTGEKSPDPIAQREEPQATRP